MENVQEQIFSILGQLEASVKQMEARIKLLEERTLSSSHKKAEMEQLLQERSENVDARAEEGERGQGVPVAEDPPHFDNAQVITEEMEEEESGSPTMEGREQREDTAATATLAVTAKRSATETAVGAVKRARIPEEPIARLPLDYGATGAETEARGRQSNSIQENYPRGIWRAANYFTRDPSVENPGPWCKDPPGIEIANASEEKLAHLTGQLKSWLCGAAPFQGWRYMGLIEPSRLWWFAGGADLMEKRMPTAGVQERFDAGCGHVFNSIREVERSCFVHMVEEFNDYCRMKPVRGEQLPHLEEVAGSRAVRGVPASTDIGIYKLCRCMEAKPSCALYATVKMNDIEAFRYYLRRGVNVDELHGFGENEISCLEVALSKGHTVIYIEILQASRMNHMESVVRNKKIYKYIDVVRYVLEKRREMGLDITITLNAAIECGSEKVFRLLLEFGADPSRKDARGQSALDGAKSFERYRKDIGWRCKSEFARLQKVIRLMEEHERTTAAASTH